MTEIMDAITASKTAAENQFKNIKEKIKWNQDELKRTQEEMTENVVRKVKRSRTTEFKKKGNEKQFRFNDDEVAEKLEAAQADLQLMSSSGGTVEEITTAVDKTKKAIRSEYGWDIVKEYEADELAKNSDDEKRMKAEKAAEQRLLKKRKRLPTGWDRPRDPMLAGGRLIIGDRVMVEPNWVKGVHWGSQL